MGGIERVNLEIVRYDTFRRVTARSGYQHLFYYRHGDWPLNGGPCGGTVTESVFDPYAACNFRFVLILKIENSLLKIDLRKSKQSFPVPSTP